MPRFHLHVQDGRLLLDTRGSEFPDLEAAKAEATARLQSLRTSPVFGERVTAIRLTDAYGNEVAQIR